MIAFTSFPVSSDELSTGYSTTRHRSDVEADISTDLDEDFEAGGSKVTYPGESLTSAQSFMRWVFCFSPQIQIKILILKYRGHGTYVDNEEVISSVAGTIERVNKLITVRPVRTRRVNADLSRKCWSDMADILQVQSRSRRSCCWADHRGTYLSTYHGRQEISGAQVNQVQPRRWKVDANSRQDAVLMLSSVNLPGGVQVGSFV